MKKFLRKSLFAAALLLSTATASAASPQLYGIFGWTYWSVTEGVYKFSPDDPSNLTEVYAKSGLTPYEWGAVFLNNKLNYYYRSGTSSTQLITYSYTDIDDKNTWQKEDNISGLSNANGHTALAVYEPLGEVYGCFYNAGSTTSFYFGKTDFETQTTEKICDLPGRAYSMAINDMGTVYWIDLNGNLYEGSLAGNFQIKHKLDEMPWDGSYSHGAVIDPTDGTFYWSFRNRSGEYYFGTIDLETGEITKENTGFSQTYRMANVLYIPKTEPAQEDPKRIDEISISADNFSTDITISFTVPSQTVGGTALSGDVKLYVAANGVLVVDGESANPGSSFTKQVSVADGPCVVAAYVVSDDESLKSEVLAKHYFAGQDTPEAVKNLTANYSDQQIVLTWDAPEQGIRGGEFDKGNLQYTVAILANDKGEAGETLVDNLTETTYTYTLADNSLRLLTFEVTPHSGSVTGESAKTEELVVGEDYPGAVQNLKVEAQDKLLTVSWEAPVEGANKGNFDKENVKYKVILLPNTVLAEEQEETTLQYTVTSDVITTYQFAVIPVTKAGEGVQAESNVLVFGSYYEAPFTENFDGKTLEQTGFTVIDANNDNTTWYMNAYTNGTLGYKYHSSNAADDWAISAPIKLEKDKQYVLNYDVVLGRSSWGEEILTVCLGDDKTVDAMTVTLVETTKYNSDKTPVETTFTVNEDGTYYIGFHATSERNKGYLELDNISLDFAVSVVPAPAEELTVSLSPTGGVISFVVPTEDAEGGDNPQIKSAKITLDETTTIKTIAGSDLVPGEKNTTIFNADIADGLHTVTVVVTNAAGDSEPATVVARVGDPTNVPAAAEELKAELVGGVVTLTFTVPDKDSQGEVFPKITKVTIFHNDSELHTTADLEEGAEMTHTHSDLVDGKNVYAVMFTNAAGDSEKTYSNEIQTTGLNNLAVEITRIAIVNGSLVVKGSDVNVYNAAGALIGVATESKPLSLHTGVYILKADDFASKIAIK